MDLNAALEPAPIRVAISDLQWNAFMDNHHGMCTVPNDP
jgi:hypothetical protein